MERTSDKTASTPAETAKFEAMAEQWWQPRGKFAPLHKFNPTRLAYIREHCLQHFALDATAPTPLANLSLLDIGCGGGLLCEPMARLGAQVCGIDIGAANINAAQLHAEQNGLEIDYRTATAETLLGEQKRFDIILNMEVIEHVENPAAFLTAATQLLKPDGIMFIATLNRTAKSFALAIIGAEYILRWLPRGTHNWEDFIRPQEIENWLAANTEHHLAHSTGVSYNPLSGKWQQSGDMSVNYMGAIKRLIQTDRQDPADQE